MKDLYLFITIVRRKDAKEYERFYQNEGISNIYSIPCNGTAHARTLDILGIERTEKTMILSAVTAATLKKLKKLAV